MRLSSTAFTILLACLLPCRSAPPAFANDAFPPEVAAWDEAAKAQQRQAAAKIVAELKAAVASGAKELLIAPVHYRFGSIPTARNFMVAGARDLTIRAAGATFWFENLREGVRFKQCTNVALVGLTVDYDPVPYAQGQIARLDKEAHAVELRIDAGFPVPDASWTQKAGSIKTIFYDSQGFQRSVRMDWAGAIQPVDGQANVVRVTLKYGWIFNYPCDVAVGDRLALPNRDAGQAISSTACGNLRLEDVTVHAAPQMAITEGSGAGGNVYRNCRVVRSPNTKRVLACNADVFHSLLMQGGPTIERCEFSHAGDDLINVHGFFSMVFRQSDPKRVLVMTQILRDFDAGSPLRFYAFNDLQPRGQAKVLAVKPVADPALLDAALKMPDEIRAAGDKLRDPLGKPELWEVELDRPVTLWPHDLVGCEQRMGNGTVVRGNHFHDGFVRGVLLKNIGAVVEDNTLERIGQAGIDVAAERYWLEGLFSRDVTIRNNKLIDCATMVDPRLPRAPQPGAITVTSVGGIKPSPGRQNAGITIVGNTIVRPGGCGIYVSNVDGGRIEDNAIDHPCARPPLPGKLTPAALLRYGIYLGPCDNVTLRGNHVTNIPSDCAGEVGRISQ